MAYLPIDNQTIMIIIAIVLAFSLFMYYKKAEAYQYGIYSGAYATNMLKSLTKPKEYFQMGPY
jgi:hypothetical protein